MQKHLILGMAIAGALLMFSCAPPPVDDTNGDGNGNGDGADTTVPTVAITDPAGYLAHDAYGYSVEGTADDNVGVEGVYLQNNSGGFAKVSGTTSWQSNMANLAEGTNIIEVYAKDTSSNVSATVSVIIFVDTPAPTVTVSPGPITTNADFTATLTTDTNWGYWSTNGIPYISFAGPTVPVLIKGGDGDITMLSYYGENGGYTTTTQTVVYTFDKADPVINSTPSGDITTNVPVITVLDVTDVHECTGYYSIDFASWQSFSDGSTTPSITLTNDFDFTNLRYYVTDIAGNVSDTNTNTYTFGCVFVTVGGLGGNSGLTKTDGVGDIRWAIIRATNNGYNTILVEAKTMVFDPSATSNAGVMIDGIDNLEIIGGWNHEFSSHTGVSILDGTNGLDHIIWINDATNITFDGFVMCNSTADGAAPHNVGAGMYLNTVSDSLFTNCVISNNTADNDGGGIYCVAVVNSAFHCLITGNVSDAAHNGGGVYLNGSSGNNVFGGTISYNTAVTGYGGGVFMIGGPDNNTFSGIISHNYAKAGGGVYMTGGATNNTFTGTISYNGACDAGGGISLYTDCDNNTFIGTVSHNYVTDSGNSWKGGGGIYLYDRCDSNTIGGTIENNYVTNRITAPYPNGGGVHIENQCSANIFSGTINSNYASGDGAGVYLDDRCNNNIFNGTISSNETSFGGRGGGVLLISSTNNIFNGTITYNYAGTGGGISVSGATNNTINGTIAWNTASGSGGGVDVNNGTNIAFGGTINSNITDYGGGVFLYESGSITFTGIIEYNTANTIGGGVYMGNTCVDTVEGGTVAHNVTNDWYEQP